MNKEIKITIQKYDNDKFMVSDDLFFNYGISKTILDAYKDFLVASLEFIEQLIKNNNIEGQT
jgi:hypothetical protein